MNPELIEQTEAAAWRDMLDAAAPAFSTANGLRYKETGGGLAINFQQMPVPLFNRVIGAGLTMPLTQDVIDEVKAFYTRNEQYLIHYSAPMQPKYAEQLLPDNGYKITGAWERIVRNNAPLDNKNEEEIMIVQVNERNKTTWSHFLCDTYGFSFYEWPEAFCMRKGWRHYMALRGGKVVACRSFFTTGWNRVFSGVDAPVPGVMTTDCTADFAIWEQAIADHLADGAKLFVADIELPDRVKNKDAYDGFNRLGFTIPYTRYHYRLQRPH